MTREIRIEENGLRVKFLICENGVVELQDFSSSQVPEKARSVERKKSDPENYHPVMEVQISGKTTRGMHGYKHNLSSASLDYRTLFRGKRKRQGTYYFNGNRLWAERNLPYAVF